MSTSVSFDSHTILRVQDRQHKPYFMMTRAVVQNRELSYAARGLLAYLLSKPDNWRTQISDLELPAVKGERHGTGRHVIYKLIHELAGAGHLARYRWRDGKQWVYSEIVVYEEVLPSDKRPTDGFLITLNAPLELSSIEQAQVELSQIELSQIDTLHNRESLQNRDSTKNRERSRADAKDYDDVPKQDRLEIIKAYVDALPIAPVAPYKREANQNAAADIFRAGYRAGQVFDCVKALKASTFWMTKTLTLTKVAELMPEWLLSHYHANGKKVETEYVRASEDMRNAPQYKNVLVHHEE